MKYRQLLFLGLLLLPVAGVRAQITITAEQVRSAMSTRTATTEYYAADASELQSIAGRTGGNQTFDFSAAEYEEGETLVNEVVTCSAEVTGCDDADLSQANLILRSVDASVDSTGFLFVRIADDGVYYLGAAGFGDFDEEEPGMETIKLKYSPAMLAQRLPFTMGTEWDGASTATFELGAMGGFAYDIEEHSVVDAWGTLVTPQGSEPALRVRSRVVTGYNFGGIVFTDTTYSLNFMTSGRLGASLELDASGEVLGGGYTVFAAPSIPSEPVAELPERASLDANYPNPFNPQTTIPFTLHEAGPVRLTVLDVLGREVAVLVDGVRPAGSHDVAWQADAFPSGLYLYRLDAAGTTVTRSMTLVK